MQTPKILKTFNKSLNDFNFSQGTNMVNKETLDKGRASQTIHELPSILKDPCDPCELVPNQSMS